MNARLQDRWVEVSQLLDRVLDLAPAARPEFLQAIRSQDPWLEAEIERLLGAMISAENFLQDSAPSYAAPLIRRLFEQERIAAGTRLGAYEIISELGRGGTATVYLAHDPKHRRRVAIKVPHVEVASAVRPERFLREIEIAAQLQHPNILPVHDSGESDGVPYYVMPYVEGESLRQRLIRERQLSLAEALHIVRPVADALAYAHSHGVIHRDIKPENILLSGGRALVADFGIARAMTLAGGERLNETGPLGTAAYMSPEQAAADAAIDGRSDIYSLGCVMYEMLSGTRPFSGESRAPAPLLGTLGVTGQVEHAVHRALAKNPADRFGSATGFLEALERGNLTATQDRVSADPRRWRRIASAGAALALAAVAALLMSPRSEPRPLDDRLITLLPLQQSVPDSELSRLGSSLDDLLSQRLAQIGGVRIVDPATLRALHPAGASTDSWTEAQSRRAATRLRAGQIVRGNVALVSGRLSAAVELLSSNSGSILARADGTSDADSLDLLARQLAGTLLARAIGEPESRIPHLIDAQPAALRRYLEGRKEYKRGHPDQALDQFVMALREDSTFAEAALAAGKSDAGNGGWGSRGTQLAWAHRDRLSEADRAYLQARLGPRYPEDSPLLEQLRMWEKLIDSFQDRPDPEFRYESLYQLADLLFHNGAQMGIENAMDRAKTAFTRAHGIDSTFPGSTEHLLNIAFLQRDTATLRRMIEPRLRMDLGQEERWNTRWALATATGDSATVGELAGQPHPPSLVLFIYSLQGGVDLASAERTARLWVDSATTEMLRLGSALNLAGVALTQGRPAAARAILDETAGATPVYQRLYHAMYWDGDTASAAETAARLSQEETVPRSSRNSSWYQGRCALEMWRLFRGQRNTAMNAVRELRSAPPDDVALEATNCAYLLEQWYRIAAGGSRSQAALEEIDDWLRSVPPGWRQFYCANLLVVHWREARGELRLALNAARRRALGLLPGTQCLSSFRREEGRLSLAVGDTAAAIVAWHHYLALRSNPEESLQPEVHRIAALVALLQESRPGVPPPLDSASVHGS